MPKKPPIVEVVPKSARTLADITGTVDVLNVTLSALLSDAILNDPSVKGRLLLSMTAIRDSGRLIPDLKIAYDRAIDLIQSLRA